jgi:hypothetical protein
MNVSVLPPNACHPVLPWLTRGGAHITGTPHRSRNHSDASPFRVDSEGRKCAINSLRVTVQIIHPLMTRDDLRWLRVLHYAEITVELRMCVTPGRPLAIKYRQNITYF